MKHEGSHGIPSLRTERLVLRGFSLNDAKVVQKLAGDERIAATTILIPHPYPDGLAEEWIGTHEQSFAEGKNINLAITEERSGELIGAIGLTFHHEYGHAEMGYWIAVSKWGMGYCTEAAREMLRYGFLECGLHRIHAHHFGSNPASGKVMEKIGMKCEGRLRDHIRKWDRYEDAVYYGVLRDEWSG